MIPPWFSRGLLVLALVVMGGAAVSAGASQRLGDLFEDLIAESGLQFSPPPGFRC